MLLLWQLCKRRYPSWEGASCLKLFKERCQTVNGSGTAAQWTESAFWEKKIMLKIQNCNKCSPISGVSENSINFGRTQGLCCGEGSKIHLGRCPLRTVFPNVNIRARCKVGRNFLGWIASVRVSRYILEHWFSNLLRTPC